LGRGPAWWKREVKDYVYQNARQWIVDYHVDGLRFDVTTQINGNDLRVVVDRLRREFPDKYFIAEHLPDHPWIVKTGRFCATWDADSHHECQRALAGQQPLQKVKSFLGWDGYDDAWNLVKYTLGSHDDIGDDHEGDAEHGRTDWDKRHRYFVDQLGGRGNWRARAKCRLAWALNIAIPGTPMIFMGSECHMASPRVVGLLARWFRRQRRSPLQLERGGRSDRHQMRRLVAAANEVRWQNPRCAAIRSRSPTRIATIRCSPSSAGSLEASLTVANLSEHNFTNHSYGVRTGDIDGQWMQVLCTQDAAFGGWDGAGNAFYEPWTQADGQVYINLPKWSVVILRRKP
jgi:1,4-alpha-glucan branching enzyme